MKILLIITHTQNGQLIKRSSNAKINLYENIINNKKVCLDVSKYNNKISECSIFSQKKFAFIGISLGNSYFNEERLELIIRAFSTNFERVAILLVDELSIHNFKVMGYSEKKIKDKIRKNKNVAKNRILRSIEKVNVIYKKNNIDFYTWSDVESFNLYHKKLDEIIHLYNNNMEFQQKIYNTTKNVIEKYLNQNSTDLFIEESKWYFIKEIAFGCCVNDFFNENEILNCYYQDFKFYREFFESSLIKWQDSKKQDFIIYNCLIT